MRGLLAEPLQLVENLVQSSAVDELHGVIRHALMFADGKNGDDIGMVQLRRRLGLALEALPLFAARKHTLRHDLEGDVPAKGDLLRFVNDSHAASADLADDAIIAELLERGCRLIGAAG